MALYTDDRGHTHGGRRKRITGGTTELHRRGGALVYSPTGKAVEVSQIKADIRRGLQNEKKIDRRDQAEPMKKAFNKGTGR